MEDPEGGESGWLCAHSSNNGSAKKNPRARACVCVKMQI